MSKSDNTGDNIKDAYTSILQDNIFMCNESIKKSNILLQSATNIDSNTFENLSTELVKLLERMNTNLSDFVIRHKTASDKYRSLETHICKSPPSNKKKTKLSLNRNHETQETDDSKNPEIQDLSSSPHKPKVKEKASADRPSPKNSVVIEENGIEIDESSDDDDSQKSVPLGSFHIELNESKDDGEKVKELKRALNDFLEEDEKSKEAKTNSEFESATFDFDDEEFSRTLEQKNKIEEDKEEGNKEQVQRNNHELLELLKIATDLEATEEEGDEAMHQLEVDVSLSSDSDSDASSWWSLGSANNESEEREVDDLEGSATESDVEKNGNDEPEVDIEACKNFSFRLNRVDELSDAEIDRLCNLHNLNKRKCSALLRPKGRKPKRARILSTSESSLSDSLSDLSSTGSTTPDLNLDEQLLLPPIDNGVNVADLADELIAKLSDSDEENKMSSDSETDIEEEPKKDKKKKVKMIDEAALVKKEEEEEENDIPERVKRKCDDPLLSIALWSDSESEFESDSEKRKSLPVVPTVDVETTVISDSSDSDDDVTFISDDLDDSTGKGRRNIRAIIEDADLNELTQRAKQEEDERIERLEKHSKELESIQSQHEDFILDLDVNTKEPLIVVDPNLAKKLKPHQKTGVQFMWEACYESVDMLKTKSGGGCILGHCMGLGKTLQVITLIHTLFTHPVTNTKHVLVVCPLSTVSNWKNEFRLAFKLVKKTPNIHLWFIIKQDLEQKCRAVRNWREEGGVLVIGYEAFQKLTFHNEKKKKRVELAPVVKQKLFEALINPGPDLIVCDEGHLLKNGETLRNQSLQRVKTRRRIALTGTPLQNNLAEYFFMVEFVKPNLLGTEQEYKNRFVNPIMNGQYHNSTQQDIQVMKKRTHVLTKLLKKTIHRVETRVLEGYLPEIEDFTIFIKLEPLQIELYKRYISLVRSKNVKMAGFFQDFRATKYISLHPYTVKLYHADAKNRKKKKEKEIVLTEEDVVVDANKNITNKRVDEGWYEDLFPEDVDSNIMYSAKMRILLTIVNETVRNGEKLLIFFHQLPEMECVDHFLKKCGTKDYPTWRPNVDYYRMDGSVPPATRSLLCDGFNTNPKIKLFLISHGVGGLGLNLTAASRVILIASNHNPSHDTQSIYRAYRFGQTKRVFVYRLLSLGTMEEKIYRRCVVKLAVAGTVVDKYHIERHFKAADLEQMYEYDLDTVEERPIPSVPNDKLLATLLQNNEDVFRYHEHKALLENRPEEELNDEEKKLAWDEFQKEEAREEAVKNLANTLPLPPLPPPVVPSLNRYNKQLFPANPTFSFNGFGQYCGPRNNVPNVVVNPISLGGRGPLPRGFPQNPALIRGNFQSNNSNIIRPILPSTTTSSIYRPQFTGYNRNVPRMPNSDNPPSSVSPRDVMGRLKVFHVNPVAQRFQILARDNVANRTENTPPNTGEFNYALNKIL